MFKTITYEYNQMLKTFVQIKESWFNNIDDATNDLNHLSWSSKKQKLTTTQHRNQMDQKYGYNNWSYIQNKPSKKNAIKEKAKVVAIYHKKLRQNVMYTTLTEVDDTRHSSKLLEDQIFDKISKELQDNIDAEIAKNNPFKDPII